uniref:phage tail protein n=1 Tax=Pseudomonas viridiflava TaxID=33069 RepID=UPI0019816B94
MSEFYTLLTNGGLAYETLCKANGTPIKLTHLSVGDGGGSVYNPDATAKALRREVWRGPINALMQDAKNPSWLVAEQTLPDDVGGWYVREAGIWTDTGILYAVIKYPESFKPVISSGSGKEFYLRAIFETSNAANVVLAIDDTIVKATRAWVVDYVANELARLDAKKSVRAATTGPIVLSGAQTVDGVPVVAGDSVGVFFRANAAANGICVVANGAWSRRSDADLSVEVTPNLLVSVEEGARYADTLWQLTTNAPIVLDTTALA